MNPKKRHNNTVQVTPAIAAEWLKKNTNNRKLRPGLVQAYAEAMRNKEWKLTPEPVIFCNPYTDPDTKKRHDETLMDGQHRLAAVVESGCTVPFTVWWGCEWEEMAVLGQGRRRTIGDVLHLTDASLKNPYGVTKVAVSFLLRGLGYNNTADLWMVRRILRHIPREIAATANYQKRLGRHMGRELAAAAVFGQIIAPGTTVKMLEQLHSGIGMGKMDPVRILYRYIHDEAIGSEKKDTPETRFYKICNGVAHVLQKQETDRLKQTTIGIEYLRNTCKPTLDLILADLPGVVPRNFYTPQISNRRRGVLRDLGLLKLASGKNA